MQQQQDMFEAIIVLSRFLNDVQSQGGYAFSTDIENLQTSFVKDKRQRPVNTNYCLTDMLTDCNRSIFKAVKCGNHCLNSLFPVNTEKDQCMLLRPSGQYFNLPLLKF